MDNLRRSRRGLTVVMALALLLTGFALSQTPTWEMRVCADPRALPFSSDEKAGFENRIAEILVEELGARLTYDWYPQGVYMIDRHLREGTCDMIIGVPDGYRNLLTTIAYYRSPYVFVYRADSPFDIQSLDDPVLHELDIGVQSAGIPPHTALLTRGLAGNVVLEPRGHDTLANVIEAVANGEVDVGLAWGPVAGYYAKQQSVEIEIVPVTPAIVPPRLSMVLSMTIGVRPGDVALRDRLNIAIANSWEEIQDVLRDYGVPLSPLPKPAVSSSQGALTQPGVAEPYRIGVVTPTKTGSLTVNASLYDIVGEAAMMGALLAEAEVGDRADALGIRLDILRASSPGAEAAVRAAERLIATEDITALVGGLGKGQAEALSAVAAEHKIPFFNIGSPSDALRNEACSRYTFHIAASAAMYLDALVTWHAQSNHDDWFIVYEDSDEGTALQRRALDAIAKHPSGEIVGTASVAQGQPIYRAEFDAIRESGANVIMLLVGARDQIAFLAQLEVAGLDLPVASFPHPITQTRDYLATVPYLTNNAGYRAALWETTLESYGAGELNTRYTSRWGVPMNPTAWAAFQSINILFETIHATGSQKASDIVDYLESPQAMFDVQKGTPVSLRPWNHQLRQPLYIVKIDPEMEWGPTLSEKVAIADLVAKLPDPELSDLTPTERLDRLGDGPGESVCQFQ